MILLLLKVTVLLAATLAITGVMRRSSAALRHLICVCGLAGAMLLALTLIAPSGPPAFRIIALSVPSTAHVTRAAGGFAAALARTLLWLWLAGMAILLVRLAVGYSRVGRLLRNSRRAQGPQILFTDVPVPLVTGLLRPVILLPRTAETWPPERLDAALRHEREHLRRKDLWSLLLSHVAYSVYWFHPLAWMVAAQLRREQEQACDDAVILSGFSPASYAEALIATAQNLTTNRLIGCPMLTQKTFHSRIARLLANGMPRVSTSSTLRRTAFGFAGAVITIGLLSGKPQQADQSAASKTAPHVISRVDPEYTEEAHADKLEGTVLLSIVIDTDGTVHDINVLKGLGDGLDAKAVEAVQKWKFAPGTKDGLAVKVKAQIEVNFRFK